MEIDIFKTDKKYNIIYADPPWSYNDKKCNGNAEGHYPTMKLQDIKELPINEIADKDCILFIWGTYPLLHELLAVVEAWGFKYKSIGFQWIKLNRNCLVNSQTRFIDSILDLIQKSCFFGLGRWTRGNTEPCFIAVKGKPKRISASVSQLIFSPLRKHSQKPEIVRDKIIELVGDQPRIELFAREHADGWDCWGNEV